MLTIRSSLAQKPSAKIRIYYPMLRDTESFWNHTLFKLYTPVCKIYCISNVYESSSYNSKKTSIHSWMNRVLTIQICRNISEFSVRLHNTTCYMETSPQTFRASPKFHLLRITMINQYSLCNNWNSVQLLDLYCGHKS